VVDVATDTTVATVPVGDTISASGNFYPFLVAVAPDGMHAYVTCVCGSGPGPPGRHAPLVSVIDAATNAVTQVYGPLDAVNFSDQGAFGLAVTQDGSRVYVAGQSESSSVPFAPTLFVVDTATNTVVASIVDARMRPFRVAITPDGSRAYVTDVGATTIHVIDTNPASATYNTILTEISTNSLGVNAASVAITPDGSRAYVPAVISSNPFGGNPVLVIDTNPASPTYNTVLTTVIVGAPAAVVLENVAITPDGSRAYITQCNPNFACTTGGGLYVIDTNPASPTYNTQIATVSIPPISGRLAYGVAITSDGTRAYVTSC